MGTTESTLSEYLDSSVEWTKIQDIGVRIFKDGHLEDIDDLILMILPIINITYYKHISWLDDRYYAKEDLIQDAIAEIYSDMRLRWDKYINVDNYPKYFERIARNVMINLVHAHHNYYRTVELNPELNYTLISDKVSYDSVEVHMMKSKINLDILKMTRRLANCRGKYAKILNLIIDEVYENKNPEAQSLRSKLKVVGIYDKLYEFLYSHVVYLHKLSYNYQKSLLKGNNRMQLRIEDMIKRYESPTYEILSNNYGDSIIPEIFAEFGPDIAKKFVRTFSGQEVKVPDYQHFCDDLLGGTVYALAKGDKQNLYQIAVDNKLPYRTLARIFDKVAKFYGGR